MAVHFTGILFRNHNSIPVELTVEAPIGTQVNGPQTVAANSSATINPRVQNCSSTLLTIEDGAHGTAGQTFALAQPGAGRPSYLESVDVDYTIGSFWGALRGRTDN
jgi:hypothetical protein